MCWDAEVCCGETYYILPLTLEFFTRKTELVIIPDKEGYEVIRNDQRRAIFRTHMPNLEVYYGSIN